MPHLIAAALGATHHAHGRQVSNVETAIVFRTLVPVITSYADYAFMGREAPSRQSATGLAVVCLAALVFALCSKQGLRLDTWL